MNAASPRGARWTRWGQRGTAGAVIPASLEFRDVSHRYGDHAALDRVSLAVEPGEVIALLGPSGCGKTTLLRIAAGVERQTAGSVLLDGRVIAGEGAFLSPEDRGIGLMFQDYALFPHLTNLANVMFGLRRVAPLEARRIALAALDRVGLAAYAEQHPDALSGGEQQRVALARAIAPRPRVLLMDEPFSGLDKRLRDSMRDETLGILRETHATCLIVTHDPEEAMRMADRIVLLRRGRIAQIGTAAELYRRPVDLHAARFFCEMNEISAVVEDGCARTAVGHFAAPGLAAGPAVVAVRPQAITLGPPGGALPGRLLERRFLGEFDAAEVAVEGLDSPLHVRLRGASAAAPGDEVTVTIDPAEALVFEAGRP